MNISKALENKTLTTLATGVAGTVYVTTAIKAIGRPAFIMSDKKSDPETKKYTATKEFLYQVLCLGLTVAMIPFFKKGGGKIAENILKKDNKIERTEELKKNILEGGAKMGDLVGSILGLTILAPLISHEILHPIMKAIGMDKKHDNNIGKPGEIFLADAKVPTEKTNKINVNA